MEYKYEIGQLVRVRPDLENGEFYAMASGPEAGKRWRVVSDMMGFAGQLVHIRKYSGTGAYWIEEMESCVWTDEMFTTPTAAFYCKSLL